MELSPGSPYRYEKLKTDARQSYLWGDVLPASTIIVDGNYQLQVSRKLSAALRDLRSPTDCVTLWIDAVCISQQDLEERARQVQLMRELYSKAQTVHAWIDTEVDPTAKAFGKLSLLGDSVTLEDFSAEFWHPVAEIFRNSSWYRVWIQQELILAKSVVLHCRDSHFDGGDVFKFQLQMQTVQSQSGGEVPVSHLLWKFCGQRTFFLMGILNARDVFFKGRSEPGKGMDILSMFMETDCLRTSIPHDHVFGLLGILTDVEPSDLIVDYELSLVEIYAEVMKAYLAHHKSLRFLCFERADVNIEDTPSWLPRPENGDKMLAWLSNMSYAAGRLDASEARIHSRERALDVHGVSIDRISFLGQDESLNEVPIYSWMKEFRYMYGQPLRSAESQHWVQDLLPLLLPPWKEEAYRKLTGRGSFTTEEQQQAIETLQEVSQITDGESITLNKLFWGETSMLNTEYPAFRPACAAMTRALWDRRFLATENKRIGLTTLSNALIGDEIWIIFGCPLPAVLRPFRYKEGGYILLDVVDIPSLRHGEACEGIRGNEPSVKAITIW